jgi:hypothetical protein
VLSWDVIQRLREEHRRGLANNAYELFGIIMFDQWWSAYIENGQGSVRSADTQRHPVTRAAVPGKSQH